MVVAAVLFGLMAYLAKHASRRVGGGQVAFVRFAVGLAAVGFQALVRRAPLRPVRHDLLFLRGFFGGIAVLMYFLSIARLPVGTATLLNYTAPVFTATFAALFLRERLPARNALAMGIAGAGVVLVVYGQGKALGGAYGWQAIALLSAVAAGAAVTAIRAARRTDGAWEVFTAFCLIGMACTAPSALSSWKAPDATAWALLVSVGLIAVVAQVLMTHALGAIEAATSGIISQLTVITALAMGHWLDDEPVTALALVGALLVIAGVSAAARERPSPSP